MTATFQFTRIESKSVQIDLVNQELFWAETVGLPSGVKYEFNVASSAQLVLDTNKISFSSPNLLLLIQNAGKYMVSIKTLVPTHIISAYSGTNSDMGYITSEYGDSLEVEKLGQVNGVTVTSTPLGTNLAWQAVENAEKYNIYLSESQTSLKEKVLTTTNTEIICGDWFSTTTKLLTVEAVASGKITGAMSSGVEVTQLNKVADLVLNANGILNWNTNIDVQILPALNTLIEVFDGTMQKQFEVSVPSSQTNYDLSAYTTNLFLKNLLGGAFTVSVSVSGAGNTESTVLTLTSQAQTLNAQKLFAPTIEIVDNNVIVIDTNAEITTKKYMLAIKVGNDYIETEYSQPVAIPEILENYDSYEISCHAISEAQNILNSNITQLTKTRLEVPQNLTLSVDSDEKIVTISWAAVNNASAYQIFVDNNLAGTASATGQQPQNAPKLIQPDPEVFVGPQIPQKP